MKILLVDEDEMIRILFRDIFWIHAHRDGYEVMTVARLSEARKIIEDPKTCPDIFFLDLSLPKEKDGVGFGIEESLAFIREMKETPRFSRIPIVVYSGYNEPDLKHRLLESGADHYMVKGELLPKDIVQFVDRVTAKKHES